jgi:hypothetical protein
MTPLAVGSGVAVLAVIGLVVGLVVLIVVIQLLQGVLTPLRKVLADVRSALTAPMLERGIPGTDQLSQTRRLADSVPDLALRYLQKLSLGPRPVAAAPSAAPPAFAAAPAAPSAPAPAPASPGQAAEPPAWHKYRS